MDFEALWKVIEQDLVHWSTRVLAAIAIFVIGRWITRRLVDALGRIMQRREIEPTVARFLQNLTGAVLLVVNILAALNALGIPTASMLAVMGAAGLAIGLALKDSLSNIASGVLMVAFRPFRVGDFVECAGTKGKVEKISVFYTELRSIDNKLVIVPNSLVTSGVITNYTADDERRLELSVGVGYGSDIKAVRELLLKTLIEHPRVLKTPAPQVGAVSFGDSAINFVLRPWVLGDNYWDATFEINEAIKHALEEHGIEIPFPQRVTRVIHEGPAGNGDRGRDA
ncbi:MAG: mechanosensitive ion channel family protein [Pseudomonadota bacterium]